MAYPLRSFRYSIFFGGSDIGFSEVSGLTLEYAIIKYRHGPSKQGGETKMPGRPKVSDVILKKGVFPADSEFYTWITQNHTKLEREDVLVKLLDEEGTPKMTWKLLKAWPTKVEGPSFKEDSNEVAVESITLAYEEMTIEDL